jgi:hypothetical protein
VAISAEFSVLVRFNHSPNPAPTSTDDLIKENRSYG